ncbi:MAG: hypothetical protein IJP31_11475 [Lachnospiraceae bacterium]|nr:hypothetical protein [Lachnospiraceae bacterium]
MKSILSITANLSEEEKMKMLRNMTGKKLDGNVDYDSVNETALMDCAKRDRAKQEILVYMLQCMKEEYKIDDPGDLLLLWEDYKAKHNIVIKEQTSYE